MSQFKTRSIKGWKTRRSNRLLQIRLRWILAVTVVIFGSCLALATIEAQTPIETPQMDINAYYRAKLTASDPLKQQVFDLAVSRGMSYGDIERFFKIITCESGWDPEARLVNLHKQSDGRILTTVDRGLAQLNDYHQKQVSNSCAYDAMCNANEAISIAQRNGSFDAWVCNKLID